MNWGNKLLLCFIVFATGMGYLVYRSTKVNFELVEKDYYKSELKYQEVIEGVKHLNELGTSVKLESDSSHILLQLPEEMKGQSVSGRVWFYCAYDEKKDKKFVLQPDAEGRQYFQRGEIADGNYTVRIDWTRASKNYFTEIRLTIS